MEKNLLLKCLLIGITGSINIFAQMTVDTSNGILTVTSTKEGTVIAKIIGPKHNIIVNEKYAGNSFSWTPSGISGAYLYEVKVITHKKKGKSSIDQTGGILEIGNSTISSIKEKEKK